MGPTGYSRSYGGRGGSPGAETRFKPNINVGQKTLRGE